MQRPVFLLLAAAALVAAVAVAAAGAATVATVRGTAKADVLRGTAKADVIYGLAGNDKLYGNAGNDRIYPGLGIDTVSCGAGSDRVYADAKDKVARDCEIVTRPATPTPTPKPPVQGTRENPIALGKEVALGDGWRMKVDSANPDATAAILDYDSFNDPPVAGRQYFLVHVTVTFTGQGSDIFEGSFRLRAVGAAALGYSGFENGCGDIPDELSENEVFTGGTISGNACWEVRSNDAASLVLYDAPPSVVPMRLFFSLR